MFSRFKPHGSFKNDVLQPLVMGAFLSDKYLKLNRLAALLMSKLHGKASQIDIFVAADDAHSYLLLQCAQILLRRYALHAVVWVLPPGTNGWASSFDVKYKWGVRDAGLLAALYGLKEPLLADMCPQSIALVTQRMQAESKESGNSVARTLKAMSLLWDSGGGGLTDCIANTITVDESLEQNAAHLSRLGYYNPGAIHFQGEFYPPNRLHHLERRLLQDFHVLSKDRGSSGALLFNHEEDCERDIDYKQAVVHSTACPQDHTHANPPVELYYSFRSPYSQLILPRLRRVCSHYGHSLILRPVLPMVTRGLKVIKDA